MTLSITPKAPNPTTNPPRSIPTADLHRELLTIRRLVRQFDECAQPPTLALPGNASFLEDGRVLCLDRTHGDSRYPYGADGFNFWVSASGYMHANDGVFFLFLPARAGQEPPIAFLGGWRNHSGQPFTPFSLLPVPCIERGERDVLRRYAVIGHDATWFVTELSQLRTAVRVHLDQSEPAAPRIHFALHVGNVGPDPLEVYTSAYLDPLCRHQFTDTCEDRWFKRIDVSESPAPAARIDPAAGHVAQRVLPAFEVAVNEDVSRFRSVTNQLRVQRCLAAAPAHAALLADAECTVCTARTDYTGGHRRNLASAAFLETGCLTRERRRTTFIDNAIVGDLNRFHLPPGAELRIDYALSLRVHASATAAPWTIDGSSVHADRSLEVVQQALAAAPHDLGMTVTGSRLAGIADGVLNRFFPFLIKQVAVCAEMKGYMQPSPNSLIGVRDVFQAVEAHLYDDPAAARRKICEALEYVLSDGRCPRQYSLPTGGAAAKADLREFIDQGMWVISTLHTYLRVTGDFALLDEALGYHRISTTRAGELEPADERDSVREHLARIMAYLWRQRDPQTGLVLALYGDWNDALDGLGVARDGRQAFGTGVSVMASLQLYRNCTEMLEIVEYGGGRRDAQRAEQYRRLRTTLRDALLHHAVVRQGDERRIVHGWGDLRSYEVGSFHDCDGRARDGLTSNAFWVLAGMLEEDPSLRQDILAALRRLDGQFGLRTFVPGFAPDAPGVGRIPKLPLGTAENGATYVHATAFGVMALFRMGEAQAAWDQIGKVLPFAPHHRNLSHSPFVMPNSYVHNGELGFDGESMNDWQTGSSNVLLKALIHDAFGLQPGFDGLRVNPAHWQPFAGFELRARVRDRRVLLRYAQHGRAPRRITLNGGEWPTADAIIPYTALSTARENVIDIQDPLASA